MNDSIEVKAEVQVTPALTARMFWEFDSRQQADFFAELERIAGVKLCFQMSWVVDEIAKRAELGDYAPMHGFQTMLAHAKDFHDGAASWRAARAKADIHCMAQTA